jgi:hypothetical protein
MGPLQLMQGLAGAANQALPLGLLQLCVARELRGELLKQALLMGRQALRRLTQIAVEEGVKVFTPALQIAKATIGLQLKTLLQRPQPVGQAQA